MFICVCLLTAQKIELGSTNQLPAFYRRDALPVAQPKVSNF